jgi:hypothetical protein
MPERPRPDQVFVVRTWSASSPRKDVLRGRVEHVASGGRRYFSNFGDLCDFLAEHIGPLEGRTGDDGAVQSGDQPGTSEDERA